MDQSDSPSRELTLDEAVALAILLQKNDQLAEAGEVYRRVLAANPEHPDALHFAGVLAHQEGRSEEAAGLIEKSLTLDPRRPDCFNNLGIVYQSIGQFDRAITAYERAIELDPNHANAYSNLGVLLRATGKPSESEAAYRTAIRLNPEHIDAYTNLGILLNGLRRTEEASACYCKVITLRPRHREARRLLALAHCMLGEVGEAVKIFEEWLREDPDDPVARHMLSACTGRDVPVRASDGFVAKTFDSFAASFESKLQALSYRAPALVAASIEAAGLQASKQLDVLDAGCGTGLCGALVAPYARHLVGVDLSEGMLSHAREKHVYGELVRAELTGYLQDHPESFDLIVSADTLVYFGDLRAAVAALATALRPNGMFVCTLEHRDNDALDYRLEVHGRYSHSRAYVERLLAHEGLHAEIELAQLRMEAGSPVAGLVVRSTRKVASSECASVLTRVYS